MPSPASFSSDRDRVRDASDIVRVIGEHLQLKPKGREFVGLCPFHDDHKPSMNVVPAKQIFHCFSCGAGGDVFTFVQRYHKMEFREALEFLAEKAGIALSRHDPHAPHQQGEDAAPTSRAALIRAATSASAFFRNILKRDDIGRPARDLIARRGLSPDIVEKFSIGASPDRWDGLLLSLQKHNVDPEPYIAAGLLKRRESGSGLYDAFRNRLMFPIHDQIGRVIAFGARRIDDADEPKYLNSPESRIFDKSSTLYALHHASRAIQRERVAIVTEGYMDAIACHQGGFENCVATLGTALTRRHAATLKRLCDAVILLFDSDDAGLRAADRAVEVLLGEMLDVRVATLAPHTSAKDPDELLKAEDGPEVFRRVLAASTDLLEFRFARLRSRLAGAGLSALDRAVREELARLAELGLDRLDPIRRQLIVRRLAEVSGLDGETIARAIPAGRSAARAPVAQETPAADAHAAALAHIPLGPTDSIVGCVLVQPSLWTTLEPEDHDALIAGAYRSPVVEEVVRAMSSAAASGREPGLDTLLSLDLRDDARQAAVSLHERLDRETSHDPAKLAEHFEGCVRTFRRDRSRAAIAAITDPLERHAAQQRHRALFGDDFRALPRQKP